MSLFTPFANIQSAAGEAVVVTDGLLQWIDPAISATADQSGVPLRDVSPQGGLSVVSGAYDLDGTSGYFVSNDFSQNLSNTSWTWCAWMNIVSMGTPSVNVISNYRSSTGTHWGFYIGGGALGGDAGKVYVTARNGATSISNTYFGSTDYRDSTWHYFAAAYDSSAGDLKGWVDGSLLEDSSPGVTGDFTSGQDVATYGGHLSRAFANAQGGPFQLYDRMLLTSEVLQNYNADKGRFGL